MKRTVKVRRTDRGSDAREISLTLAGGTWDARDEGRNHAGNYVRAGRKYVLTYDAESADALANNVAKQIEERAARDGISVSATVLFTRMKTTVRTRNRKKKGPFLLLREKHRFTVTTTGDINEVRHGVLKTRGRIVPSTTNGARRVSALEVAPPYIDDPNVFWARSDLYVMQPDLEPLDRWPDEVLFPNSHGVKIIVLLPGDYRGRSNGRLGDGTLYIEDSGTAEEPLLVTFAPQVGADLRETPHPAERMGVSEARLLSIRIWNQKHQYFRGLTFRDGVAASLLHTATDNVIDRCLWHETSPQPLRIRFDSHRNLVQRCVMRRFDRASWGHGDVVAINLSDGALTDNHIVSNVILNYTDSYQHTDRVGEDSGLGAGTRIDNNVMGFTPDAYVDTPDGELMCGENTIDMKMGGTSDRPVRITNNTFFGVRAAQAGCGASGSGGYAVTLHRQGTWVEMTDNLFVDMDSGIFLNVFFQNVDPSQGRIDPHLTFARNTFSGIRSFATAFPSRTGRVLSGASAADFRDNQIAACERLMEQEVFPSPGELVIEDNVVYGPIELAPRDQGRLEADGNTLRALDQTLESVLRVPWSDLTLRYRSR